MIPCNLDSAGGVPVHESRNTTLVEDVTTREFYFFVDRISFTLCKDGRLYDVMKLAIPTLTGRFVNLTNGHVKIGFDNAPSTNAVLVHSKIET